MWDNLKLLRDLRIDHLKSAMLFCDNQVASHIAASISRENEVHRGGFPQDKITGVIRTFHVSSNLLSSRYFHQGVGFTIVF